MEEKIIKIMAKVFEIAPESIDHQSSLETIEGWDSQKHLSLIVELEDEFDIEINEEQLTEMVSFPLIVANMKNLVN